MNIGGMSYGRGIQFNSGAIQVKATVDGQGNLHFSTRKASSSPMKDKVSKIPFLRGFFAFGQRPVMLILLIATLAVDFGTPFVSDSDGAWLNIAGWVVLGILALVAIVRLFFMRDILQYHAAEHMAINTYEAGRELTVENITKASRMHHRCGTMWAIYLFLVGIPCSIFIPYVSVAFFLIISISYELFLNADKIPLLRWLSKAGLWLQKKLTTAEPEQRHIDVARQCLLLLLNQNL